MIRNLKSLAAGLVAMLAMSAAAAAPAQALPEFTAAEYPATIDGSHIAEELPKFTAGSRTVTCEKATFTGLIEEPKLSTLSLKTPAFTSCHSTLKIPATVEMNGCYLSYGLTSKVSTDNYSGTMSIVCEVLKKVEISIYETAKKHEDEEPLCLVTIPAQTGIAVDFINETDPDVDDLKFKHTGSGIEYEIHGSALACGSSTAHKTDGELTGTTTVSGTKSGSPISLAIAGS